MKILLAQPVFLPNKQMAQKNIDSVKSFTNIDFGEHEFNIKLGGWSMNDDIWDHFIKEVSKLNINVNIKRFDSNYGKAYVVNELVQGQEFDFLLTCDSDIIFENVDSFIDRLIESSNQFSEKMKKPFGMFGLNQKENNCHLMENLNKSISVCGVERVKWNNYPGYIAGGCIFTSYKNWNEVGGYREMGVYAGDDAFFLLDTDKCGNCYGMIETISVIHPNDKDPEIYKGYYKWKFDVCQRDSGSNKQEGISKDQINESIDFWKNMPID